jgi:cytoskeletal protein RodZ
MKLKYYMRGLGIGIILTTLIFIISGNKEKLTDQEIRQRAGALGMVMNTESESDLDKVLGEAKPTNSASEKAEDISPAPDTTNTSDSTPDPEATLDPEATTTTEQTLTPEPLPSDTSATDAAKTPLPTDEATNTSDNVEDAAEDKITFTIVEGMPSDTVAELLYQKGIVDDAVKFNQYLIKEGKASIILVGTYHIEKGASYQEIMKLITTK